MGNQDFVQYLYRISLYNQIDFNLRLFALTLIKNIRGPSNAHISMFQDIGIEKMLALLQDPHPAISNIAANLIACGTNPSTFDSIFVNPGPYACQLVLLCKEYYYLIPNSEEEEINEPYIFCTPSMLQFLYHMSIQTEFPQNQYESLVLFVKFGMIFPDMSIPLATKLFLMIDDIRLIPLSFFLSSIITQNDMHYFENPEIQAVINKSIQCFINLSQESPFKLLKQYQIVQTLSLIVLKIIPNIDLTPEQIDTIITSCFNCLIIPDFIHDEWNNDFFIFMINVIDYFGYDDEFDENDSFNLFIDINDYNFTLYSNCISILTNRKFIDKSMSYAISNFNPSTAEGILKFALALPFRNPFPYFNLEPCSNIYLYGSYLLFQSQYYPQKLNLSICQEWISSKDSSPQQIFYASDAIFNFCSKFENITLEVNQLLKFAIIKAFTLFHLIDSRGWPNYFQWLQTGLSSFFTLNPYPSDIINDEDYVKELIQYIQFFLDRTNFYSDSTDLVCMLIKRKEYYSIFLHELLPFVLQRIRNNTIENCSQQELQILSELLLNCFEELPENVLNDIINIYIYSFNHGDNLAYIIQIGSFFIRNNIFEPCISIMSELLQSSRSGFLFCHCATFYVKYEISAKFMNIIWNRPDSPEQFVKSAIFPAWALFEIKNHNGALQLLENSGIHKNVFFFL